MKENKAIEEMLRYYRLTADAYDVMHLRSDKHVDEHAIALNLISSFINLFGFKSILDVGCGTGRGLKYLYNNHPDLHIMGVDLSFDLLKKCVEKDIPAGKLLCGNAYSLPFKDASFDVVISLALLHHVPDPNRVVEEMLRVSKNVIFISDTNRYGQGSLLKRFIKLILYKVLKMGKFVDWIRTRGKMYMYSEGDGVFYSYSVFDSLSVLRKNVKKIIAIPTGRQGGNLSTFAILKSSHFLICAFKGDDQ